MTREDQVRLVEAFAFAVAHHDGQVRKGDGAPFLCHLMRVAETVLAHGGGADQAIAALLHDVVERCEEVDYATLAGRFGSEVSSIVRDCSDTDDGRPRRARPWGERKALALRRLRAAPASARLVALADKIDGIEQLVSALGREGAAALARYGAPIHEIVRFHAALAGIFERTPELPPPLVERYQGLVAALRDAVARVEA